VRDRIAEQRCEGFVLGVVQMLLIAEEDDLMPHQCGFDGAYGFAVEITGKLNTAYFGADTSGYRAYVERRIGILGVWVTIDDGSHGESPYLRDVRFRSGRRDHVRRFAPAARWKKPSGGAGRRASSRENWGVEDLLTQLAPGLARSPRLHPDQVSVCWNTYASYHLIIARGEHDAWRCRLSIARFSRW
jgi:hypothetical protein